jgi:hypothetical protein
MTLQFWFLGRIHIRRRGLLDVIGSYEVGAMEESLKSVISFFLRAKHWQTFVLMCGSYFAGQMAIAVSLPEGPLENHAVRVGLLSEALMSPFIVCFMGWLWSIGSFLSSVSAPSLRLDTKFFRFSVVFSALHLLTA